MRRKKKKILFICSYSFSLESYALRLRQENFDVFSLEDANDDFVGKVVKIMPDLIYLYIVLPGRDGFMALGLLKADVRTKNIPIIFENRKSKIEDIEMGIKLGAVDYLVDEYTNTEIVARTAMDYLRNPHNYITRYPIFIEMLKAGHIDHKISKIMKEKMTARGIKMFDSQMRPRANISNSKQKILAILVVFLILLFMIWLKIYLVR